MPITQTFTPTSGTDGRVKTHAGDVILAGVTKWSFPETAAMIPIPHFESSANADGVVYPNKLRGLGDGKITLEGIYNLDSTSRTEGAQTLLRNGLYVALDLYLSKTLAIGYDNVVGWVSNFERGQQIDNQACKFTCTIEIDGVPPAVGAVT